MTSLREHTTHGLEVFSGEYPAGDSEFRRYVKEHTYCFMCARTYFCRMLDECPHCGSQSIQHYTSDELHLFGPDRNLETGIEKEAPVLSAG